jgi:hypothetical protein
MNWEKACQKILSSIHKGMEINTKNSSFRKIIETPPYKCSGYDYCEGFKVRIGTSATVDIPLSMLKTTFENSLLNQNVYNKSVFIKNFSRQQEQHPCHVHVVGQIFVNANVAVQDGHRNYNMLDS